MRYFRYALLLVPAFLLTTTAAALAYERPGAVSLSGQWEVAPVKPLIDLAKPELRAATLKCDRPDFPTLAPRLEEVVPSNAKPPADAQWRPITVPCAWEQVLGIDYNYAAWYRRSFQFPEGWLCGDRRMWLEFDAVSCAAGVWLNGVWLGGHVGDYSRWRIEMTRAVHPGSNELLVYVDELPGHVTQGFLCIIMPHHGGIWQDVRMYGTGALSIEPDGVCALFHEKTHSLEVSVQLSGPWDEHRDRLGVQVEDIRNRFRTAGSKADILVLYPAKVQRGIGNEVLIHGHVGKQLKPWSPASPVCYCVGVDLQSGLGRDDVIQSFAVRDIRTEGYELKLNGERVSFRSALNWGSYPRIVSPAPPPEVVRQEFRQIKSLGFNAETVCLVIMPDYFYDIADEEGILLWQEYPTWHATFDSKDADTYLREFEAYFRRDRAHPSIILRSMSCEAGVAEHNVMPELYRMSKDMTETPSQDNTSWFWLSNPDIADWYDEHNYYSNNQWVRYTLDMLPGELAKRPPKPFLIGESIIFSTWPDTDALFGAVTNAAVQGKAPTDFVHTPRQPLPSGLSGTDEPSLANIAPRGGWPYWFPRCFQSVVDWEAKLRARYNSELGGKDIVHDYLMPQTYQYALDSRRFQMELMFSSPRYAGYTINTVRDVPLVRAGLIDDLGRLRWTPEQWAWHSAQTKSRVQVGEEVGEKLSHWDAAKVRAEAQPPCLVLDEGYRDMKELTAGWAGARHIAEGDVALPAEGSGQPRVLLTSVLTHRAVDFAAAGGAVVLLGSKWPGAFGCYPHFYWRDEPFAPPVGLWAWLDRTGRALWVTDWILEMQMYDLTRNVSQVIPSQDLGIVDEVDPLVRLFDTHDLPEVAVYDQLVATRVGKGLLIVSAFDHATPVGQWLLAEILRYATEWVAYGGPKDFPQTSMEPSRLNQFAVARANGIMALDEGWRFKLDPQQQGERLGYQSPTFDDSGWDNVRTGIAWEALGYDYDGMAWYRKQIDVPADWAGLKLRLIAEGVDDAYTVWVNGQAVQTHGSFTVHEESVWLKQTVTDLTGYLKLGERNTLALQVVDITGQGGIYKPLYIATE